jgi:hypothetical protein
VTGAGLTVDQLVRVVTDMVPTDQIGDLIKRVPAKYFNQEMQLYRPVTPAILAGLDLVDPEDECDERLADLIELASADPDGAPKAWTALPDGTTLHIGQLLGVVAQRLATLYSPKRRSSSTKKTAPVA